MREYTCLLEYRKQRLEKQLEEQKCTEKQRRDAMKQLYKRETEYPFSISIFIIHPVTPQYPYLLHPTFFSVHLCTYKLVSLTHLMYMRLRRVKISAESFQPIKIIGRGAFGEVCTPHYLLETEILIFCV